MVKKYIEIHLFLDLLLNSICYFTVNNFCIYFMHTNMKSKIESADRKMIFVSKSLRMTLFVPVFDTVFVERKSPCIGIYVYRLLHS